MPISTNGTIIARLAGGLYNQTLSSATYSEVVSVVKNTADINAMANSLIATDFAGKTDAQIATVLLTNLGLTGVAGLNNWVAAQITASGAAGKGAKIVSLLNDFSNLTSDVTYGAAASSFNTKVDAALALSQSANFKGGDLNAAATIAAADAAAAAAKATADAAAKATADAAAKVIADAAAAKVIADAAAAKVIADAAAAKVIADAEAAAKAPLTFSLTTGLDTGTKFTGGAGNDAFSGISSSDATVATFTSADSLVGGIGTDTLTVAVSGTITTAPSVITSGIEELSLINNSTGASYTLDATLMSGLSKVSVSGGLNPVIVNNTGVVDVALNSTSKNLTVSALASAIAGASDAATVTLNGAALAGNVTLDYSGVETLNIAATGASGDLTTDTRLTVTDTSLKTANITGPAAVRLGLTTSGATAVDAVGVVNASAATGNIDVTVAAGTSGLLSITGGSGSDTINVGSVTKEMTIAGGAGTDTLVVSSAAKATAPVVQPGINVSGFETLEITASGSASIAAFPSNAFTTISAKGTATVSDLGTAAVTVNQAPATAGGTLTATRATDGTADTITVNLNPTTTGTFTGVSIANEETVTIRSSGVGTGANTITTLTATSAKALTITGDRGLTVTTLSGAASLASIDASANTGTVLSIDASNSTVAMTVKGSAGSPTSTTSTLNTLTTGSGSDNVTGSAWIDNISTGNGNDTISAGAGNDTVTAGAGNDVIDAGEGDNNINGGTGNDSITAGAGNDLIDGGGGSDTISAGAGDDLIAIAVLNSNTSVDGGAGTDRLSTTTGTITSTTATSVRDAMIPVTDSAAPKLTSVNSAYVSITPTSTSASSPLNLDLTGVTDTTTLFVNPIDASNDDFIKVTNFSGSAITVYGALSTSVETKSLVIDGTGQAALTVSLEDYDTANTSDIFTVTDVSALTISGRSTSQMAGSADQNSSLGVVTANGADTITVSTTGSGAANTTALTLQSLSASVASTVNLTAGTNDTLKITAATGLVTDNSLVTSFTATGGVGSNFDIDKVNLGTSVIATTRITVGEGGAMSTDGNTTITAGQYTDFDAGKFTSLTVDVGAAGVAQLDLSGIETTASTLTVGTSGSIVLRNSLGVASKASSFTFTGRGDVDFDTGGAVNNTVTLLGSTVSFNTSGLSVDTDGFTVGASAVSTAATVTTGVGNDSVTGGSANDSITTGLGADTLVGGLGNDTLTLTETLSNQSTDVVKLEATVGTSADSVRVQGASTSTGDDTGGDRIVGFELANDIVETVATGIVHFVHGTHTTIGTAAATTTTGAATEFTKLTLLVQLDSAAANSAISIGDSTSGDIAVTFTSPTNSGVAVTDMSAIETTVEGRLRYNLTGTTAANTITGGNLDDTIVGGTGADYLTGGGGNDTIDLTAATGDLDTVVLTGAAITSAEGNMDTISGFYSASTATSADILLFGSTFTGGVAFGSAAYNTVASNSITSDNSASFANKIVDVTGSAANYSAESAAVTLFGSAFSNAASEKAIFLLDNGTNTYIYYVDDSFDGVATTVTATDVVLIGIVLGATGAPAFTAATFGTAV